MIIKTLYHLINVRIYYLKFQIFLVAKASKKLALLRFACEQTNLCIIWTISSETLENSDCAGIVHHLY